jgi:hypothetical protein
MDRAQINELLTKEPFVPFRFRLADGSGYDITNPALVVPMQTKVFIVLQEDDHVAIVSNYQIVALETLPNRRRGKGPRRKSA